MLDEDAARRSTQLTTSNTSSSHDYSDSINSSFGLDLVAGSSNNIDDGLQTSTSGAVFVGPPLSVASRVDLEARRRLSDDGGLRRLMSDLATGDDVMPPPPSTARPLVCGPTRLVGGVLGPRGGSVLPASSRVRGAVLAKSCGDAFLKRAAVGLSTAAAAAAHRSPAARSPATATTRSKAAPTPARVAGIRSSLSSSQLADDAPAGGRVPSYLALGDHRYTLRAPPPPNPHPPPSKIQRTGSGGMRTSASQGNLVGVTSILEAFLRSTRPLDPNKGSNAALAAAGLAHLPLRAATASPPADDDDGSGTLLKKLLTGEINQNEVQRTCPTDAGTISSAGRTSKVMLPSAMDSLLAVELDFDGDFTLDDPRTMSLSLLDDVADDGLWITAHTDDFDNKVD